MNGFVVGSFIMLCLLFLFLIAIGFFYLGMKSRRALDRAEMAEGAIAAGAASSFATWIAVLVGGPQLLSKLTSDKIDLEAKTDKVEQKMEGMKSGSQRAEAESLQRDLEVSRRLDKVEVSLSEILAALDRGDLNGPQ